MLDLVESFWRFIIPEQNISVPFLLVGHTADPHVVLDRSHLNYKSLLIGKLALLLEGVSDILSSIGNTGEIRPYHIMVHI